MTRRFAYLRLFTRLFAVVTLALFTTFAVVAHYILTPASQEPRYQRFRVEKGLAASEIARKLEAARLVKSGLAFRGLVHYTKAGPRLKAGYYSLSPHMRPVEILQKMIRGEVMTQRITIPEGYSARRIALLLEQTGITGAAAFLREARDFRERITVGGKETRIEGTEGYLFPDTYELTWEMPPREVVDHMLDHFKAKILPELNGYQGKLLLHEVVTLASLVEREAKLPRERPLIARVYLNRLKRGMHLECDATIQYLLEETAGSPKELLTFDDLKVKSPYNTYLNPGLPPGPIGNPGLASIRAVLKPARGAYLFYVLADSDGSHRFSASYEEHLRAVARYKEFLRRRGK